MLLIFKMFKRWHLQTTQKSDRRQCVLSVIWLIQQQIVLTLDSKTALEIYRQAVVDEHPRVRLEPFGALKIKTAEAASMALTSLELPRDRFLDLHLPLRWMSLQMCSWLHSTKGNGSQTHHLVRTIRVRTH